VINIEYPRKFQTAFGQIVQECMDLGMQPLFINTSYEWKCVMDAIANTGIFILKITTKVCTDLS
jgi:hypothetical protein